MHMIYLLVISVLLGATVAAADVYTCPDGKGRITLQNMPCAGDKTPVETLAPPVQESASLPADYLAQIDKEFDRALFDPDSRKIEYGPPLDGQFVCGRVNARNRFGGYVGRRAFLVGFDGAGKLKGVTIYPDEDLLLMKYRSGLEARLLKQCGFLP